LASECLEPIIKRTHVTLEADLNYSKYTDYRFKVGNHFIKQLVVDETLVRINGQDFWLWIAYEPNLYSCLTMHIYQKGLLCVLPITQASKEYIWKETICTDGAH
jgi:hypothetical protein